MTSVIFRGDYPPKDVKTQLTALLHAVSGTNEKAKKDLLDYCTSVRAVASKEKLAASQEMEKFINTLSKLRASHNEIEQSHEFLQPDKKKSFIRLGPILDDQIKLLKDGLEQKRFSNVAFTKGVIQEVAASLTTELTEVKESNNTPDRDMRGWVERALHALLKFLHINPNYQYKSTERREAQKADRVSFFAEAQNRLKPEDPETNPSVQVTPKP